MIKKILIANRGEIACRIIRAAHKMGIQTVAVYSDPDRRSLAVQMADEAVGLGGITASETYLNIPKIIKACLDTGADAVHPGYGFLSENSAFAHALEKEGIIFIAPPVRAIEAMGDKIQSKKYAQKAGLSLVPGFIGEITSVNHAATIAEDIGYPIMLKASAGGGGKGMRIIHTPQELPDALALTQGEAQNNFGDGRLFIEKYIPSPRHIEIQILGDQQGNIVHLFERECSIQRRHQKVIEEAPSAYLLPDTRVAMAQQACDLAKSVGYYSAGTVEFITDQHQIFYFLEMNTRLQVEHPVTELITGIDLVEMMIRVAQGEALPFSQSDIQIQGHAFESRLCAENPVRHFMPVTGQVTEYSPPVISPDHDVTIRMDSGLYEGSVISPYYDSMLAKLCVHAPTREQARHGMIQALSDTKIEGIGHNIDFLISLYETPRFQEAYLSTHFIEDHFPRGWIENPRLQAQMPRYALTLALSLDLPPHTWLAVGEFGKFSHSFYWDGHHTGYDENTPLTEYIPHPNPQIKKTLSGASIRFDGAEVNFHILTQREWVLSKCLKTHHRPKNDKHIIAPTPGIIRKSFVSKGTNVHSGDKLLVIESMKMENILTAERNGTVDDILYAVGQTVQTGDIVIKFS